MTKKNWVWCPNPRKLGRVLDPLIPVANGSIARPNSNGSCGKIQFFWVRNPDPCLICPASRSRASSLVQSTYTLKPGKSKGYMDLVAKEHMDLTGSHLHGTTTW
uniref:Uncharacterized protein n=1 Tax=Populus trichocarpa TaxID=3694 RepID=A0A2K1Z0Z8_POPTR